MDDTVSADQSLSKVWPIKPMAKPRMTRGDRITMAKLRGRKRTNAKEAKRVPILSRWLAYSDEVKYRRVEIDLNKFYHVIFVVPYPRSWSEKKRDEHAFTRHQSRPDKDNLEKGLLDILFGEDCAAWDGRVTKVWGPLGFIAVSESPLDVRPERIQQLIEGGQ